MESIVNEDIMAKTPAQSRVETCHIVRPMDMNSVHRLYGGVLMCWIDEIAVLVARRHTQLSITTGSVDNLRFLRPAYLHDTIVLIGKATYVGNTSMEVKVSTYVEQLSGERELINEAYLTLIGLDENDKPCRLPRLIPQTEKEKEDWKKAEERRNLRKLQNG